MIFGMNAQIAHEDVPRLVGEAEFMQSLNWSERSLAKAVADGSVFVMRQGGLDVYPSFFADPRFDQRHLKVICRRLGDLPGGSKWQFFTTPKGSLGGITPLVTLQRGMRAALVGAGVNPRLFAVEDAAFCECRA